MGTPMTKEAENEIAKRGGQAAVDLVSNMTTGPMGQHNKPMDAMYGRFFVVLCRVCRKLQG